MGVVGGGGARTCKVLVCILYMVCIAKKRHMYYDEHKSYRDDPKFSDRLVWANSAYPDQTAPRGAV